MASIENMTLIDIFRCLLRLQLVSDVFQKVKARTEGFGDLSPNYSSETSHEVPTWQLEQEDNASS